MSGIHTHSPHEAISEWNALVAGDWSIRDQFDAGGWRYLFASRTQRPSPDPISTLSAREYEVAGLVALGYSNKLIAYELGLQTSTVSSYLTNAFRKLGVSSRVDLVRTLATHTRRNA